jgi:hypothetical protein
MACFSVLATEFPAAASKSHCGELILYIVSFNAYASDVVPIQFLDLIPYGIMMDSMVRTSGPISVLRLISAGLIRWGIVIHGFIDGYSRLITGLQASNNNKAVTVLDVFMAACLVFGVPSRLRGDHGVKNLLVAAFMEHTHGHSRGSYIWGRYVVSFNSSATF